MPAYSTCCLLMIDVVPLLVLNIELKNIVMLNLFQHLNKRPRNAALRHPVQRDKFGVTLHENFLNDFTTLNWNIGVWNFPGLRFVPPYNIGIRQE